MNGDLKPCLLGDLGGTYLRLAWADNHRLNRQVFRIHDYADIQSCISAYQEKSGCKARSFRLASSGHERWPGRWYLTNNAHWREIDFMSLKNSLQLEEFQVVNDFQAQAYGLSAKNPGIAQPTCLIGAGSGLGLGYVYRGGQVSESYGGHMHAAAWTDEQWEILRRYPSEERQVIFEDLCSGRGLEWLRDNTGEPEQAFHEFLGIFAHYAVIFGHAYGGLWLTGGVFRYIDFEESLFRRWMTGDPAPIVRESFDRMPIHREDATDLAFEGLIGLPDKHTAKVA